MPSDDGAQNPGSPGDWEKRYYRGLLAVVILGSVAGGVFGARYIRDLGGLAKQAGKTYERTHPPIQRRAAGVANAAGRPATTAAGMTTIPPDEPPEVDQRHPADAAHVSPISGRPGPVWDDEDEEDFTSGSTQPPPTTVHPQAKPAGKRSATGGELR